MYLYDAIDQKLVDERVAQFRDQTRRFLAGRLAEDDFRALRLRNGLYIQRYAPMLRIAIPYGLLSATQLRKLADLARRYDRGYGHFSTRQNLQLNWPRLEDETHIMVAGSARPLIDAFRVFEIPEWMQKVFATAIDVHWTDHVLAQAVWQKWISNAIAKTINMPGDVTAEDVKCSYLLSHELGLKGVTVYRDGSRHEQVLHITGKNTGEKSFAVKPSRAVYDYVNAYIKEVAGEVAVPTAAAQLASSGE